MRAFLKLFFVVLAGLGFGASAFAGGFDARRFGVEGSWTMNMAGSITHNDGHDDITNGFNVGVCYKMANRHGWFVEPTVSFSYGDYTFYDKSKGYNTSLTAIELPIKFGHDFKLSVLDMTVSPLIAIKPVFALGGHLAYEGVDYHWNRFNVAGCFGFGLLFNEKFGINIRGDINILKSIHALPKGHGFGNHNGTVNITAKYYF